MQIRLLVSFVVLFYDDKYRRNNDVMSWEIEFNIYVDKIINLVIRGHESFIVCPFLNNFWKWRRRLGRHLLFLACDETCILLSNKKNAWQAHVIRRTRGWRTKRYLQIITYYNVGVKILGIWGKWKTMRLLKSCQ